jgi:hypothetical protein
MRTICVVHGVGFFRGLDKEKKIKYFCEQLAAKTGATCTVYSWDHTGQIPDDSRDSWLFKPIRRFVQEVIMDFSYVLKNLSKLIAEMPAADMYVGHSAGSVIVGSSTSRPQVLTGSPLQLIRSLQARGTFAEVINIMHYRDPIASPLTGVENIIINRPRVFPLIDPIIGHMSYWDNDEVIDIAAKLFKEHYEDCHATNEQR